MDIGSIAGDAWARWGWIVALLMLFAVIYRFASGRSTASTTPAGTGCLVIAVITALFFLIVIL